jgi:integrase
VTPRKASLRVAHQAHCPNANKTALDTVDHACTKARCSPSYYTFHRNADGDSVKGARVKNRTEAQRELNAIQVKLDQGRLEHAEKPARNPTLPEWVAEWEQLLAGAVDAGDLRQRTMDEYLGTARRACDAIGHVKLRQLSPADLRKFYATVNHLSPAGRARELRHLNICLNAAVDEDNLDMNPVAPFKRKLKLKVPKRGKAPFEDGELDRIWVAYRQLDIEPVYLYIAELAVEMGGRLGEMCALDWPNVNVRDGEILIEWTYSAMYGIGAPKDYEVRTVYLTTEARQVLEDWIELAGAGEAGPVFPNPIGGGRLQPRSVLRNLNRAMKAAGVPKEHPKMRLPRSFHSLRYTTSVLMQRRGKHPRLIGQTLGHSSLELTYGTYGAWTPAQLAAEAARDRDA